MKKKLVMAIVAMVIISLAVVQIVIAGNTEADTQEIPSPMVSSVTYQYAAKFICGKQQNAAGISGPVVPGIYMTAINIHNPQIANVTLKKKVVLALSEDVIPRPPSQKLSYRIQPDYAFEIDCQDIAKIGGISLPFFKGFVVIESPKQLDVVGVYTSANLQTNNTDLEVVPISPKAVLPATSITAADIPPE
jgi:hypothetical protein